MAADFASLITGARLREIVARNREGLDGAKYLPVHADDLRVLLDLAEERAGAGPAGYMVTGTAHSRMAVAHFESTLDAAGRAAAMLVEQGFTSINIERRS